MDVKKYEFHMKSQYLRIRGVSDVEEEVVDV